MFDLILYPLNLAAGRETNEIPGLLVTAAPRKAARMRAQDQLILCLTLRAASGSGVGSDSPAFSPAQQQEMLERLAETYFSASGSVTAGLRTVTARLNDFLLSRNLKAGGSVQTVGVLNMAVIHGSSLYAAHAGRTHTFVLGRSAVQHFDDQAGMAGRGLGLARQSAPRFYQAELQPGDLIMLCTDPPQAWTSRALAGSPQLSFEQLRRRLLSDAPALLRAAVIRTQAGKGRLSTWKPGQAGSGAASAVSGPGADSAALPAEQHSLPRRGLFQRRERLEQPDKAAATAATVVENPPAVVPQETTVSTDPSVPAQQQTSAEPEISTKPAAPAEGGVEENLYEPQLRSQEPAPAAPDTDEWEPAARVYESTKKPRQGLGVFLGGLVRLSGRAKPHQPSPRPGRSPRTRGGAPAGSTAAVQSAARDEVDFSGHITVGQLASVPHADGSYSSDPVVEVVEAGGAGSAGDPEVIRPRGRRAGQPGLSEAFAGAAQGIRGAWQRGAGSRAKVSGSMATTARKVMPRRVDEAGRLVPLFNFSAGTMLGIAILIPVIVVAVATAVYFQAGRGEQFQVLYLQAQQYAEQTQQLTDPLQQRAGWTRTLELLDEAEAYNRTDESKALRRQARAGMDTLEGIVRLDYSRAVRSFTADVNITRMAASLNDVYLLDNGQGRIIRLYRTATGYEVDAQFSCGATESGALEVRPLVDLALPQINNEPRATVVGLDETGNLVYCAPNMDGFESRPLAPPDNGWGRIQAMKIYSGRLYVLDPPSNAVYYYDSAEGVYPEKPHFYFGESIPKMDDVIDIAIDQEFLYLLHGDGQMTICEGGGYSLAPTTCADAPYGDPRPGMEPAPLRFDGANFTQLQATQPPDPSLFALDAATQSIFHLSLRRLNLQREYRPRLDTDFPVPNTPPTAFAVAPNRRALVAFGNQVFFAPIP